MSQIPIPNNESTSIDPCYRYMRNRLQVSTTKKCNVMNNLSLIAKQLQINESMFLTYLQKETGQNIIEVDSKRHGIRSKTESEIEDLLETFIKTYVVCKNCGLPELSLLKKDESYGVCNSCGYSNHDSTDGSESKKRSKKSKTKPTKSSKNAKLTKDSDTDDLETDDLKMIEISDNLELTRSAKQTDSDDKHSDC